MKLSALRAGLPGKVVSSYCAPSCLPVGRDPALKSGVKGYIPIKEAE